MITSFDPRTAVATEDVSPETSAAGVAACCAAAAATSGELRSAGRAGRAAMLAAMADALESQRAALVAVADRETALGPGRLDGELTRATFQLRFFADVICDGGYLEAVVDHAGPTPMGPRPDLRRMLVPLGPVGVFGASNFPFAFSVPGGDTVSALAAGCPVVVKAHEAHPRTSQMCAQVLRGAAAAAGVSADVVSLVFGREAGAHLVTDPRVTAVGFTGSPAGGQALAALAASRPVPIPFYGELGALNPVVVCPAAATARPGAIAEGLAASFTLSTGQFCTKPGLALVPAGPGGDALVSGLAAEVAGRAAAPMLSEHVHEEFTAGSDALRQHAGVSVLAAGAAAPGPDCSPGPIWWAAPLLLEAPPETLDGPLLGECFGPVLVVVRYQSPAQLTELLGRTRPALTATVHAEEADSALARELVSELTGRFGRMIWNGYPTGLAVAWATHHGGPHPATTAPLHTSVGAAAIRRWLLPVAYQDMPQAMLPPELADDPPESARVPRRVDGRLALPAG